MPPLRRWRPLIAIVATWLLCSWFFLSASRPSPSRNDVPPRRGPLRGSDADADAGTDGKKNPKIRWSKLPDRYPVTSLRALPTGTAASAAAAGPRIPRIQKHPAPTSSEDAEARRTREERLAAVRDSFRHSWEGYRTRAWMRDEVGPLTGGGKDPFGGWAATLVDALDTLWIMGLREEFAEAAEACRGIDFAAGPAGGGGGSVNVFETTIRYLGGFLAAHELSGGKFPVLLDKAVEVGELLMCAFDTPNRMPISRWSTNT